MGPGDLWSAKGEIMFNRLLALVKVNHLHFACNNPFQGTIRREFEMHVTLIYSFHPRYFNVTAHKVATEEADGTCIVHSHGINFVSANVARIILDISPNGVLSPIDKVAFREYGLLACSTSFALE